MVSGAVAEIVAVPSRLKYELSYTLKVGISCNSGWHGQQIFVIVHYNFRVRDMVLNTAFNNISGISWLFVLQL
jgi:hypothetical protein